MNVQTEHWTEPVIGVGVRHRLPDLLTAADRVLVVASPRVASHLEELVSFGDRDVEVFTEWSPNPSLEQGLKAGRVRSDHAPEAIVAIGGGSAIDVAKMARSMPPDRDEALAVLRAEREPPASRVPLIALPTTAGSGSEVTRFATVYVEDIKHSLDHRSVRPDIALVDPELLRTCPPAVRYSCAFDALCHAVESFWSTRATPESRELSLRALRTIVPILGSGAHRPGLAEQVQLATAATTAGRAIDITRTTAAHAFSYRLTWRFGVPHGVACLLNLRWLLDYNLCSDHDFPELAEVFPPGADQVGTWLAASGFRTRLADYGVRAADLDGLLEAGLRSGRAAGNPRALDPDEVAVRLGELL